MSGRGVCSQLHAAHGLTAARPCPCLPTCSKVVRKSIARVLTVISQKQREALKEAYAGKVRAAVASSLTACCLLLLPGAADAAAASAAAPMLLLWLHGQQRMGSPCGGSVVAYWGSSCGVVCRCRRRAAKRSCQLVVSAVTCAAWQVCCG